MQRRLKGALTERLGYKAAALFFALVLWFVVSAEEPSEQLIPVRLDASYDSGRILTGPRPVIRALVAGRARDLIKLYHTPPVVRRMVTDDAPDSVAMDLRPLDVYIPPRHRRGRARRAAAQPRARIRCDDVASRARGARRARAGG